VFKRNFLESLLPHTNLDGCGFPEMIESEEILVAEACKKLVNRKGQLIAERGFEPPTFGL
jgi:hypothetical protein